VYQITNNKSGSLFETNQTQIWIDPNNISILEKHSQKDEPEINIQLKDEKYIDWHHRKIKIYKTQKSSETNIHTDKLTIRQPKKGDKLNGKKLKDIMIKAKIPRRHRHTFPIVTNNQRIIGVLGLVNCPTVQNQTHCYFNLSLVDSELTE